MEFKQLEAFVQVVNLNSFSKAADAIFLSQPSVSAYISSLEKELQTQLVFRSTKEVFPTKAGKIFYEYAKNILVLRDKSIFSLKKLSSHTIGESEILASSVPSQYILPELLAEFHKSYPGISFKIMQADSLDVIDGIAKQKCEFGISGTRVDNNKCFSESFMSDKLILIAPNDCKFKDKIMNKEEIIDLIHNEFFVMREQGSGTRILYEKFLKELGINLNNIKTSATFYNTQSILHAVHKGLGISIVSELSAKQYIDQKLITEIYTSDSLPTRDFYFVFKRDFMLSHISEIFIEFIRSYFQKE